MSDITAPELIFSLDIGTRSVVGLIVETTGEQYRVLDCAIREHDERSMLDGQIHDIVAVAKVIQQIKEELEGKYGKLHQVAVAAAGRSLRTRRIRVDMPLARHAFISREDVVALEFSAVQEAQAALAQELKDQDVTRYYCVGYSVVNYHLDGELIGSLIDQRGDIASADVIATFLPRVVVDSLIAALKRCDLEMQALTLEPIAAINVLIPVTMRRLNIALVDIGAGTSDVALTEEGAITAYGMVPVAGDEITDALMNAFLMDFPMAEEVKRLLSTEESVTFTDILGIEHTISATEVTSAIEADIQQLADKIAFKILELNGKAPQAVMLIGGGSLTPGLTGKVAQVLNIPAARVAVRGGDAIKQYVGDNPALSGPEFVTPVGIAVAARRHPLRYVTVTVNDTPVRIFDLRKMTLGDALIASGLDIRRLYGRPGLAMTVTVNGRMKMIPGGHGTAPVIERNKESVSLDTPINDGDQIIVVAGTNGDDARVFAKDLFDELDTLEVICNDRPYSLGPVVHVNGAVATLDTWISDRAEVDIRLPRTVYEVLELAELKTSAESGLRFSVNGQDYSVPSRMEVIELNGRPAALTDIVRKGDVLVYRLDEVPAPSIQDVIPLEEWVQETMIVHFNGERVVLPVAQVTITVDGNAANASDPVIEGADITVKSSPASTPVFSDVFRFVDVSLEKPDRESISGFVMLVNGEQANFQTELKSGDKLELFWE
ncbi:cell division protein FtsA [Brevibacillus porteri]|uniref:ATPase n=1 Tax=Brevibacillus porteri TaxID=2126350 RepID=A0ABX5FNU2_9BACL|nr:cell division FtsA domain-containing protein [Brevibacillus porteri]MED1802690.1 cell division FtsA domain-containing protein [Brevibacillus porteri]MED2131127.1 cell division FtsA domain-containing protein [Brevibacillus porteri]MED2748002.1 cell division FtsA domain-containing protein [Brevibacillus porteri]MED2816112.1 cell division FtsA domain-containing protein [Brevibacillus porteri]MED2897259.1 cell division FtsA domain-containing protein [Brevibacillus porteri]